jgi:hypothetical protein
MIKPSLEEVQQIAYGFSKSISDKYGDRGDTWSTFLYLSVLNNLSEYFQISIESQSKETNNETQQVLHQ